MCVLCHTVLVCSLARFPQCPLNHAGTVQLIARDWWLVRIQKCWTLGILGDKEHLRERGNCTFKPAQQYLKWKWMNFRSACNCFSQFFLSNSEGILLAPHPGAGHMSHTTVTWLWRRQYLDQPVISVPVYNGSLVSCCGGLPSIAASLSTLHSTSFPALPWTLHVLDTYKAFFLLSKITLSYMGRACRLNQQMGLLSCFRSGSTLLLHMFIVKYHFYENDVFM